MILPKLHLTQLQISAKYSFTAYDWHHSLHAAGGPEVLSWESGEIGEPVPGELRLRHTAIRINHIDVYHMMRHGLTSAKAGSRFVSEQGARM